MKCAYYHCFNEIDQSVKNGDKKRFCSSRCKNIYHVDLRRRKLKKMAIEYKGGKCEICGYCKCRYAMQFHHLNPKEKKFNLSHPETRSWDAIKNEADKCQLLCANCHAEKEAEKYEYKTEPIIKSYNT